MRIIAVFLTLLVIHIQGNDTLFVTYGSKPCSEIIIRYIDKTQKGFIKKEKGGALEVLETENIPLVSKWVMHRLVIQGLAPGEEVQFYCPGDLTLYKARSLKEGDFSFCVAGDLYRELKPFRQGITSIGEESPDFVIFGGDLAYVVHGPLHIPTKDFSLKRYLTYLKVLHQYLKDSEGRLIPIITVMGNHDTLKDKEDLAFQLFFPPYAKSYFAYDLGSELDLVILDTGHMAPMTGLQSSFLKQTLKSSVKPYKIAAYHIGAYPSVYSYESPSAQRVRDAFCPLFDEYRVNLAFEHHSHAFKITHPLKHNQVVEEGTIYLGDGCLGVKPRKPKNKGAFYIEAAGAIRHYYLVKLTNKVISVFPKDLSKQMIHPVLEINAQKSVLTPQ
jgi:hypothetical protein